MTTGTHRCLDLTASHWVTYVLIGRADQMPTELVLSLGRQQTKKPMLCSKYNCCGAKKEGWSLPKVGANGPWTRLSMFLLRKLDPKP